jgi:Fe2+ or Zn2+ uptake regulation protein
VKRKRGSLSHGSDAVEHLLTAVRDAGLKLTPQRIAIVRELADDPTHPTAHELFERLQPELPTMSFATVYNTLAALAEAGLCAARALERGPVRFDPNVAPHDHAVCDRCGRVMDITRDEAATGRGRGAPLEGFAVRAVERIYRGLCAGCAASGQQPVAD